MNERGIIVDALIECKEDIEYAEKRLNEVGNSNRTVRQNLKDRINNSSVRMETIIEIAYALNVISEDEYRMNPDTLIELIETEG